MARPFKEIYIDENNIGLIDTVYRLFKWKAKQIVEEFGEDKVPEKYLRLTETMTTEFEIVHAVEPSMMATLAKPKYFLRLFVLCVEGKGVHSLWRCILGVSLCCPTVDEKKAGKKYGRGPDGDAPGYQDGQRDDGDRPEGCTEDR